MIIPLQQHKAMIDPYDANSEEFRPEYHKGECLHTTDV